jgi:hypothetical protein
METAESNEKLKCFFFGKNGSISVDFITGELRFKAVQVEKECR